MSSHTVPKISVVIPTRNSAVIIEDMLTSLSTSTFKDFEVIINDDMISSDNMSEVVGRFSKKLNINYVQENVSMAQGRLTGAEKAMGDILIHLDSDMSVTPDLLQECYEKIGEGYDGLVIPERSVGESFWADVKVLEKKLYQGVGQLESLRVIKKQVYFCLGGHNPSMVFSEDKDLDIRFKDSGYKLSRTDNHLTHKEGSVELASLARKKLGYSGTADVFATAHPAAYHWQANPLHRYWIFARNFEYALKDPAHYFGLYIMKTTEYLFSFLGMVSEKHKKTAGATKPKKAIFKKLGPLVSVIVPTKNSDKFLEACLRSIRAQTYKNIELIVVDNFSTDNTKLVAQKYDAQFYTKGPERSAQVNFGVEKAKGEYVYKVDSDFTLDPNVVCQCIDKAMEGFEAVVVHNTPDITVSWIARLRKFEVDMYKYDHMHSSPRFILKSAYQSVGGFNEQITAGEDYDFRNKLDHAGYRTGFIEAEALHHGEPTSIVAHMTKYYHYGKDITAYTKAEHNSFEKESSSFFGVYLKNWQSLLRHPLKTAALFVYTFFKATFGLAGWVAGKSAKQPANVGVESLRPNLYQKSVIKTVSFFSRRFRNTWFHRLKITNLAYAKLFHSTFKRQTRIIDFRGIKLEVDTNDFSLVPTLMTGDYERAELDVLESTLELGDTFLDVGANIGVYGINAAVKIGKNGEVICFEPIAENLSSLRKNIKLNGVENVTIVDKLVSNKSDLRTKVYMHKDSIGTHSAAVRSDNFRTISTCTIDEVVKKRKLKKVSVMKVDVEGFEGFVLEGASNTIQKHKPVIFIELDKNMISQSGYDFAKIVKLIKANYGYIYLIDERLGALQRVSLGALKGLVNSNVILSSTSLEANL